MKITLNNTPENFEQSGLTVRELLNIKRFTYKMLIVKINDQVIKKEDYEVAKISEGDNVIVLHLVSGG
jgi:thiamine biosynthesis protein ThiS